MWGLIAVFCSTANPVQCQVESPPQLFATEVECVAFIESAREQIEAQGVMFQYRCVDWNEKI